MNNFQFQTIINEINDLKDMNNNKRIDNSEFITIMQDFFYEGLEKKTGWGRNQIKSLFAKIIKKTISALEPDPFEPKISDVRW